MSHNFFKQLSFKTLHTNITSTHTIFYKTHQSLAGNQKLYPEVRLEKVNTKISLQNIFLISNKSAHSIKIRLTEITALHATVS